MKVLVSKGCHASETKSQVSVFPVRFGLSSAGVVQWLEEPQSSFPTSRPDREHCRLVPIVEWSKNGAALAAADAPAPMGLHSALAFKYPCHKLILYDAQFKIKCHQCFRNRYRNSNIYIRPPISISDILVLYPTSGYLYPTSRYLYPTSGNLYPGTYIRLPISISDVRYIYWTSDIYIGRPVNIFDVRYL